jgi:predicted tellurium resistance membrane protein TerC
MLKPVAVVERRCCNDPAARIDAAGRGCATQVWASLVTLTVLEIALDIDNLVFITILAGRLPSERQNQARQLGLALALITRLASIASITGLTRPLFELFGQPVSGRDLVLIAGGLFLLYNPVADQYGDYRGRRRLPRAQGVYLRRHRLLGRGRDLKPIRRASAQVM